MKAEETAGAVAEPETKGKATETTPHPTLSPKGARETKAAPEQLGVIEGGEYKDLAVADLVESPTNPRKHYDAADLKEFAENIRTTGVLQPIVCRRIKSGKIEVVLGSRRLRASKLAGKKTIPARIVEISDMAAAEAQLIENLMRVNPHPMEEAIGYQDLIEKHKRTVEQIATKLGKSASYIYMTLVLTKLAPAVRDMFLAGTWGKKGEPGTFTKNHAQMLARLTHEAQDRCLKQFSHHTPTTRNLAEYIQREIYMNLEQAPWKADDATLLPKAGACSTCPKLSGNSIFFQDMKHKTCCTDRACYENKQAAHLERAKLEAAHRLAEEEATEKAGDESEAKGGKAVAVPAVDAKDVKKQLRNVVEISGSYSTDKNVVGMDDWKKAKVACPDPKPAVVVVEGYNSNVKVGQQLDVCINKKCKACWQPEDRKYNELMQRARNEEKRARERAAAEVERRETSLLAVLGKVKAPLAREIHNDLLLQSFTQMGHDTRVRVAKFFAWDCQTTDFTDVEKAAAKHIQEADADGLAQFTIALLCSGDLSVSQYGQGRKTERLDDYVKTFKVDVEKASGEIAAKRATAAFVAHKPNGLSDYDWYWSIRAGLCSTEGAAGRFKSLLKKDPTDAQVREFLGKELGLGGGGSACGIVDGQEHKGGAQPYVKLRFDGKGRTFSGKNLVEIVRAIWSVPEDKFEEKATAAAKKPKAKKKK